MRTAADGTDTMSEAPRYRVSERVVARLAEHAGVEPADLDPPLYDVIDPDSLDALYRDHPGPRVQFDYEGRTVLVEPDGSIAVVERQEGPTAEP